MCLIWIYQLYFNTSIIIFYLQVLSLMIIHTIIIYHYILFKCLISVFLCHLVGSSFISWLFCHSLWISYCLLSTDFPQEKFFFHIFNLWYVALTYFFFSASVIIWGLVSNCLLEVSAKLSTCSWPNSIPLFPILLCHHWHQWFHLSRALKL